MLNMQQLMQQAQKMQKQMQDNQKKMESTDFEGLAGNTNVYVKIIMNGLYTVKDVIISPEAIEDQDMLKDLLIVAFNNTKSKIDETNKNNFGNIPSLNGLV